MAKNIFDYLDTFFSQSKPFTYNGDKYVLKNYSREAGIVKWMVIRTASRILKVYPYVSEPIDRMEREVFFLRLNIGGVWKPRLYVADWIDTSIVREYVEGDTIDPFKEESYRRVGAVLGRIHRRGIAVGDTKYYNFLLNDDKTYVIDGEQVVETGEPRLKAWDIVVFLITAMYRFINAKTLLQANRYMGFVDRMLEAYVAENPGYVEVFQSFKSLLIRNISMILLPPPFNALLVRKLIGWA